MGKSQKTDCLQFKQSQKNGVIWEARCKISYHLQRNNDFSWN